MSVFRKFALTAAFVTCLPLSRLPEDMQSPALAGLSKYLPAVGLLLGGMLYGIVLLAELLHLNNLLCGAIVTLAWLALTGGIHFDGLMDTADGVFSHRRPERMLEIMTDSRVGNFGAITGFGVLLVKFACLASLPFAARATVVLLVPAWARLCQTYTIGAFPYARQEGMGKIWHETTQLPRDLCLAAVLPVLATVLVLLLGLKLAPAVALFTIAVGFIAALALARILNGHTGDTYGAVAELAESGALLCLAILAGTP